MVIVFMLISIISGGFAGHGLAGLLNHGFNLTDLTFVLGGCAVMLLNCYLIMQWRGV